MRGGSVLCWVHVFVRGLQVVWGVVNNVYGFRWERDTANAVKLSEQTWISSAV